MFSVKINFEDIFQINFENIKQYNWKISSRIGLIGGLEDLLIAEIILALKQVLNNRHLKTFFFLEVQHV